MNYCIRKATAADLSKILEIIGQGQSFLAEQGLSQWQKSGAVSPKSIDEDLRSGEGYVFEYNEKISGYASLVCGIDPVYTAICDGQWGRDSGEPYVSIHRVAVSKAIRGKGFGKIFLNLLVDKAKELGFADIRIDTHPGNKIMQRVITDVGFSYCGIVEFPFFDGERKAYQILNK